MVRFMDEQDARARRGRGPSPTRSHHSSRDRDYSPDFISGPGRAPRPYASGAIPSTATAHPAPPPVPSPPLSPPISYRTGAGPGPGGYVYDDGRDRNGTPLRGRDRSWERSSGIGINPPVAARTISVSRSRSRSRGPSLASAPSAAPGTRERHIVRETKIYGGPELRDPERAVQALAVSDARRARSPSRDSRISRNVSRSRSRSRGARSIYTTDDESDYPRSSRGASHSRRRRSPSSRRSRSRSRARRSPSPAAAPLRKAKDLYSSTFSPSTTALGVGVLGAIVGGLAAREATEHARKSSHNGKKSSHHDGHSSSSSKGRKNQKEEEERERKAALISTIVGAAVGGLGANVIEKKLEEKKKAGEEEKRAKERGGGYRELRDRDRDLDDDGYDIRDRRSRSRHGGRGSSLDTPVYSDDEGYYESAGSAYGAGSRRGGGTTTVRGGR
ncbi:uncharacterized protein B0T23DRAFT_396743 [Neurospora hispaniola]|uniref:Uncharacterized protein n=1 Tax=Neurospora hispaniola TaxID=588809 RepID=A0AAJ0I5E7_9PEZI|nr:hypothetical protein B0T23DRAFT_396743 [Neurospora hispaniola]